jgi:hypothetical protein
MTITELYGELQSTFMKCDNFTICIFIFIITLFFGGYIGLKIFEYTLFKMLLFILVAYCYDLNKYTGILLGIIIFVIYQLIIRFHLENFDKIEGVDYSATNYETNPLLLKDETTPIPENTTYKLITPEEKYKQMVEDGKNKLLEAEELQNDVNHLYDFREQNIADITKRNALVEIQTGINRLETTNYSASDDAKLKDLKIKYDLVLNSKNENELQNALNY